VHCKVCVLFHCVLKVQQRRDHTRQCLVHLVHFFTLLCQLNPLLPNCLRHQLHGLQDLVFSRVGGGGCEEVSIVAQEVVADVTAPTHEQAVDVSGQIQPHTNHRFQRAVDINHLLVLQTFLVVHEHGSKGGLHERPGLSAFLKQGGMVGVIGCWFPGKAPQVGT
jgi:hypothetical protein